MKVRPASVVRLVPGKGGLRFRANETIPAGTQVEVSQWMGNWVRFAAPAAQIAVAFASLESLVEDGTCHPVPEGTTIKALKSTLLKSMPVQGSALPSNMQCAISAGTVLSAAIVRFPTYPEATAQHLMVTLKEPLPTCPVVTGFVPQSDVETGATIP